MSDRYEAICHSSYTTEALVKSVSRTHRKHLSDKVAGYQIYSSRRKSIVSFSFYMFTWSKNNRTSDTDQYATKPLNNCDSCNEEQIRHKCQEFCGHFMMYKFTKFYYAKTQL